MDTLGIPSQHGSKGAAELADVVIEQVGTGAKIFYLYGDKQTTLPREKYNESGVLLSEIT